MYEPALGPQDWPSQLPPLFTHLHVHSYYSLLRGTASIEDLVARARMDGLRILALTDNSALYGAVSFARACRAADVQPIIGMTIQVAVPKELRDSAGEQPEQVVLLAATPDGYRSLCRLSSLLQSSPQREDRIRQGVDWATLKEWRAGLFCIAGGRRSAVSRVLKRDDPVAAARYVSRLGGTFGEHACLSVELHNEDDRSVAKEIGDVASRFGVPMVAVHPVYGMAPEDRERLKVLAAVDHSCRLADVRPEMLPDGGDPSCAIHWLSPQEMVDRYGEFADALAAVGRIVQSCGDVLPDGKPIWPSFGLATETDADGALRTRAEQGLADRYGDKCGLVGARLEGELEVIRRRGIAPFLLVVADIMEFARREHIPSSTRGSVANSLVAYCLNITTVDPVEHDLLFERFLNPERTELPDIDLDFCSRRRDEVLAYVRDKYGAHRVGLVATISTMRPRSAVRETAKAFGLDERTCDRLAKLVRDQRHPDPRRRTSIDAEELAVEIDDPVQRQVIRSAFGLVGMPHHLSIHPGGIVIAPERLTAYVPVQWTPKGFLTAQYDYDSIEAIGLPKVDILGIRALTVLADTSALVRARTDDASDPPTAVPNDEKTGELLRSGNTVGVFQCESVGAQRTLRQLRARTVRDLAMANAFFKPGPATGGMATSFIRRYRGVERTVHLHPALAPILEGTHGVLIFQEQVLRIAHEIAGLRWSEADHLRKGMSKFRPAEMDAIRHAFLNGCQRVPPEGPGMSQEQAETLWNQVQAFAGYGFNQGHATAYAEVSYRSAYFKAHWPAEFLCARLANWGGFYPQAVYIAEARRLGIDVMPPHVNYSQEGFALRWPAGAAGTENRPQLWMGLAQVRDLRRSAIQEIIAARKDAPFSSLHDLLARVPLRQREVEHLIQCGGLDGLGNHRAGLAAQAAERFRSGSLQQMTFGFLAVDPPEEGAEKRLRWEQEILGLPVSVHPLETVVKAPSSVALADVMDMRKGQFVTMGVRLPGSTGSRGWYLDDGTTFVLAQGDRTTPTPRPWEPLLVRARWQRDEWDGVWLHVEQWTSLLA